MAARWLAKTMAVLLAGCSWLALFGVAGIDGDRWTLGALIRLGVAVLCSLLVFESAWRIVWAAEDRDWVGAWIPGLVLAAGVPAGVAWFDGRPGLAVAIGALAVGVVAVSASGLVASRVARQVVAR